MSTLAMTMKQTDDARPPNRLLTLAEPGRAMGELASFYALRPLLRALPKGDGHGVLVLPGFMASDASTAPLRSLLGDLGYQAVGWGLGRNVKRTGIKRTATESLRTPRKTEKEFLRKAGKQEEGE